MCDFKKYLKTGPRMALFIKCIGKKEKICHNGRGCVFLLDKVVLGPGGADAPRVVGSQAVGQPPNDDRK